MRSDWISPWWQAMLLPARWDVCGVKVGPLSLWHIFALENIGNRYLCGGSPDRDDAASLLLFAKHDMAGGRRLMLKPHYRARQIWRMHRRIRKLDDQYISDACLEYVETCTRINSRWSKAGAASTPCGAPHEFTLAAFMAERLPGGVVEAWNMPFTQARCLFDAAMEAEGKTSMLAPKYQYMEDNWDEFKDDTETRKVVIQMNGEN